MRRRALLEKASPAKASSVQGIIGSRHQRRRALLNKASPAKASSVQGIAGKGITGPRHHWLKASLAQGIIGSRHHRFTASPV
jgi:hypothetical protein